MKYENLALVAGVVGAGVIAYAIAKKGNPMSEYEQTQYWKAQAASGTAVLNRGDCPEQIIQEVTRDTWSPGASYTPTVNQEIGVYSGLSDWERALLETDVGEEEAATWQSEPVYSEPVLAEIEDYSGLSDWERELLEA